MDDSSLTPEFEKDAMCSLWRAAVAALNLAWERVHVDEGQREMSAIRS